MGLVTGCHGEFAHPASLVVVNELLNLPRPPHGLLPQDSTPTMRALGNTRPISQVTGVTGENHPTGTIDDFESDGWEDGAADDSERDPETTGNRTNQQNTEEMIPVGNFCCLHIPRVTDESFSARRPDAPEGQGYQASGAESTKTKWVSCAHGRKNGGSLDCSQPAKELSKVSANPVS